MIKFIDSLIAWLTNPGAKAAELAAAIRSAGSLWSSTETQSKLDEKITSIQAGENVTINWLDPHSPIINAQGTGFGDMAASIYDPTSVQADAFDRANHRGNMPAGNVSGLATVATTGSYNDLTDKPAAGGDVVGPASATNNRIAVFDGTTGKLIKDGGVPISGLATSTQGGKADTAVQPARAVAAGIGLTGGGDLSADRTIALNSGSIASLAKADSAAQLTVAQQFTKPQWASATALTSGTTVTPDLADNNDFTLTLGHNATLANPSNQSTHVNQKGTITIIQDGTGGRTLSFGSNWKAIGSASAPSINTTAGVTSCIDYHVLSSTVIRYSLRPVGAA